jgi:uncharacterized protein YuzE
MSVNANSNAKGTEQIKYDPEADAMYICLGRGKYKISEELDEGIVVDRDRKGKILGIEILGVKGRLGKKFLKAINSKKR